MSCNSLGSAGSGNSLPVAMRVIEAIADAEGVEPDELDPIHEHVDLEALEAVVASANADLRVNWWVGTHQVEVDGTGSVRVY